MKFVIKSARKTKGFFLKFRLHKLLNPLTGFFQTIGYLTKLSDWIEKEEKPSFNDFYVPDRKYDRRFLLYEHVIQNYLSDPFNYLEFGVAAGVSFKWWVKRIKNPDCRFYGFDTFTGLPEAWNVFKAGDMSADGSFPDVGGDTRASFYKGIFQDTLPGFLTTFQDDKPKVIHMDADIYSATLFTLTQLATRLRKNDIVIFDEFNVPMHEFRAFLDFTGSYYIKLKMIGAVNNYYQVAFIVEETPYQK